MERIHVNAKLGTLIFAKQEEISTSHLNWKA